MRTTALAVTSGLLLLLQLGCLGDRCSPGQVFRQGVCVPPPEDGAIGDGVKEGSASDLRGERPDLGSRPYGTPCQHNNECFGQTSYCVILPGSTTGYCSTTNCDPKTNNCPPPYTCIDVGSYMPGLPSMCIKL
jgi:hypothetical protein